MQPWPVYEAVPNVALSPAFAQSKQALQYLAMAATSEAAAALESAIEAQVRHRCPFRDL